MKGSSKDSNIGRREFVKIATGAVAGAATIGALSGVDAAGQVSPGAASASGQAVWGARKTKMLG
jgi:hypothetical protein